MRLLFIGGTRFFGRAAARLAVARGHQVDVFHRGRTPAGAVPRARDLIGDRMADRSALATGQWDAVIDTCGFRPGEIHAMADTLDGRAGHYLFVSSVSAYAPDIPHLSDESAPLADTTGLDPATLATVPVDNDTYGPLKVLCEQAVLARHARSAIVRPPFIVGPDDYTQRFPEWVRRLAAGGEVVAPGPADAPVQYIDARDLATFAVDLVERGTQGSFNAVATQGMFSFGDLLEGIAGAVAPAGTRLRWITADEARASGHAFPLWSGGESSGLGSVRGDATRAQGLQCRPLADTARDTLAWVRASAA